MTSDPIRAAIEQLRADLDGLPRWHRAPWDFDVTSLYMDGSCHGSLRVRGEIAAVSNASFSPGVGQHIALTASPHVTEALANLLAVVARADYDNPSSTIEHIEDAATALATAITRRDS